MFRTVDKGARYTFSVQETSFLLQKNLHRMDEKELESSPKAS